MDANDLTRLQFVTRVRDQDERFIREQTITPKVDVIALLPDGAEVIRHSDVRRPGDPARPSRSAVLARVPGGSVLITNDHRPRLSRPALARRPRSEHWPTPGASGARSTT